MPSSHLRMEEDTSTIASKSITNGFGSSDVDDDLDNFVLQIDENEINQEIRANGLVEDLAIDVLKQKMKDNEEIINKTPNELPLKTVNGEEMDCGANGQLETQVDPKSSDFHMLGGKIKVEEEEESNITAQEDCVQNKEETRIEFKIKEEHNSEPAEVHNSSKLNLKVNERDNEAMVDNFNNKIDFKDLQPEVNGLENMEDPEEMVQDQSTIVSENTEDDVEKLVQDRSYNVSENVKNGVENIFEEDKTDCSSENVEDGLEKVIPDQSSCISDKEESAVRTGTLNEDISNVKEEKESVLEQERNIIENGYNTEDLESVDKELDSLLSIEQDTADDKSEDAPVAMEIEESRKETAPLKHSENKNDSDSDSGEQSRTTDTPPITMHSPLSLRDMVDSSGFCHIFMKGNPDNDSEIKTDKDENNKDTKVEDSSPDIKNFKIAADSNVFNENIKSVKRIKREADEETSSKQKRVKFDTSCKKGSYCLKKKLDVPIESNASKKFKKITDLECKEESSNDSAESNENADETVPDETANDDTAADETASDKATVDETTTDENGLMNGQVSMDEIKKLKEKIIREKLAELSAETMKEIMEGRNKLFANYFEGKIDIPVNRFVLEEMIMTQIIDFIAYKSEIGQLRQKCRILESEQIRMNQMVYGLKRQAENAKLIIKKLIDEKVNNRSWTQNAIPLKVTRSVGLQVCTCGSMTIRSKYFDKERKSARNEKTVSKESTTVTRSSVQNSANNVVVSSENKENISSNIERDSGNSDDVVIVSVIENNKSTPSSATKDKDNKKTVEASSKNGIIPNEKVIRKPFSIERTNNPKIPNKAVAISNDKKAAKENTQSQNDLSKTDKTNKNVAEIIDLTDKEEIAIKSENSSTPGTARSSEPVPTVISDKASKTAISLPSTNPLLAVNGIKKPPPPTSTAIKKPADISAPAADLVNSYDHLPKYPVSPKYPPNVTKPPRPILRIGKNTSGKQGIMLSWSFEGGRNPPNIEEYQLYAFQESKTSEKVKTDTWKKVGDIKALPLPMACFLTQFVEGHKYHFIVRAVDTQKRLGDFSLPGSIILHAAGQPPPAS